MPEIWFWQIVFLEIHENKVGFHEFQDQYFKFKQQIIKFLTQYPLISIEIIYFCRYGIMIRPMKKTLILILAISFNSFFLSIKITGQVINLDSIMNLDYEQFEKYFEKQRVDTLIDLVYARGYLDKAKRDRDSVKMADAYCCFIRRNNYQNAHLYADSMILITKNIIDNNLHPAFGHLKKGILYYKHGDYRKALDQYVNSLEHEKMNRNNTLHATVKVNIGLLKNKLGENAEALSIFRDYIKFLNEKDVKNKDLFLTNGLLLLADAYTDNGYYDSATIVIKKGIERVLNENNNYLYSYFLTGSGKNSFFKGKYKRAIDSLVKGKKVYKISDNASVANLYLGKSFEALGNYSESIHCFSSVDTFLQTTNHVSPELLEAYPPLINYCANNKDYKKQLYYTNNLLKFDSIADLNQQYLSLNIRSKYDVPELIKIKEELTKRLKLEQTLSRRNLLLLLLGLVVSLGIVLYYAKRSIVYKKRYRDLISKNNEKQGLQKTLDTGLSTAGSIVIPDEIVNTILRQLDEFEKSYGFSSKSCSLHHLAKEFNTNSKYLSKVINYKKGLNFSNYINNLRIDYAIKRLTNEAHFRTFTIEAIAEDIGFNKAQSYSTAFHKKTGIYPSYFIKQLEKQQTFE